MEPFRCTISTYNKNNRPFRFSIAENLPYGTHTISISIHESNGNVTRNDFVFIGKDAIADIFCDPKASLGAVVDGMTFQPKLIRNIVADKLWRFTKKLLDEHSTRIPYIME